MFRVEASGFKAEVKLRGQRKGEGVQGRASG
jgi:hypothetical protein